MHPPSPQLIRSLRSALRQIPRQSIPRASTQRSCLSVSRNLSYSPACHRPDDDAHSRKPSQKSTPRHDRRFDLSTADLKPISQERRAQRNAEAGKESKEGVKHGGSSSSGSSSSDQQRADIRSLDVFADVSAPTTAIDACVSDGFHFNSGLKITGGDGCLLVDGEVFTWRPWEAAGGNPKGKGMSVMVNEKGQWEIGPEAFGVLNLVWPRPDLLMLGLGGMVRPISPATRRCINELGIRIEVLDTRNAAAQFNLLATERGVREVAAALIPMGWK